MPEDTTQRGTKWDAPNEIIHAARGAVCANPVCGREFETHAPHGKYCRPYCRVQHSRARAAERKRTTEQAEPA